MAQSRGKSAKKTRADARRAAESEPTEKLYLKRSVGQGRGGRLYGPGWANVPQSLAESLKLSGAISETPDETAADEQGENAQGETGEQEGNGENGEPTKATKTALREYGDADALRELAKRNKVKVSEDATKADLIDALYDADVSLDALDE